MNYTGTITFTGENRKNIYLSHSMIEKMLQDISGAKLFSPDKIKNVEFFPRVVKMTFTDGTVTTAVPQEGDEYDKKTGMMVCIMKYIWRDINYNTALNKWIKKAEQEEQAKADKKAAIQQQKIQRQKEADRIAAKKARIREAQIEIQKEAYLRAMKENNARAAE